MVKRLVMSAWAWLNCKFDSAQPLLGASRSKLLATDKLGRHCVAPVQSLHFLCVLNCLAIIHCSVHPTEIISQSSNSSDTVLHFVWIKFLDKNFLYIRCSQLLVFCHGSVNLPLMVLRHLLWRSTPEALIHTPS